MKNVGELKKNFKVFSQVRSDILTHFNSLYTLNGEKLERKMPLYALIFFHIKYKCIEHSVTHLFQITKLSGTVYCNKHNKQRKPANAIYLNPCKGNEL